MEPNTQPTPETDKIALPDPVEVTKAAFRFAFERTDLLLWGSLVILAILVPFVGLGIGLASLAYLPEVTDQQLALWGGGLSLLVITVVFVLSTLMTGALYYATVQVERVSFWSGWRYAWQNFWQLAWLGVLVTLLVLGGFFLFIIPALVIGVYCALAFIIFARNDGRGLDVLFISTKLVTGSWWRIFGRLTLALFATVLLSMIVSVASMIVMGIVAGVGALITPVVSIGAIIVWQVIDVLLQIVLQTFTVLVLAYVSRELYDALKNQVPVSTPVPAITRYGYQILIWGTFAILLLGSFTAGLFAPMVYEEWQAIDAAEWEEEGYWDDGWEDDWAQEWEVDIDEIPTTATSSDPVLP